MVTYESMIETAERDGITVLEDFPFRSSATGLIVGRKIGLRAGLTSVEKRCVLAEEIAHYKTSAGNIFDQTEQNSRSQEYRARRMAYKSLVPLDDLADLYASGCRSLEEAAQAFDVTESFLVEALLDMQRKHGVFAISKGRLIRLDPFEIVEDVE